MSSLNITKNMYPEQSSANWTTNYDLPLEDDPSLTGIYSEWNRQDEDDMCFTEQDDAEPKTRCGAFNSFKQEPSTEQVEDGLNQIKQKLKWVDSETVKAPLPSEELPEFPTLGNGVVADKPKAGCAWKSSKNKGTLLVVDTPSLIAKKQAERAQKFVNGPEVLQRTTAFEQLKVVDTDQLKFTKLCRSVTDGTKCSHGANCRFAHSLDQLTVRNCYFGDQCRFVVFAKTGVCYNKHNTKQCDNKHPGETLDNYFSRTGMDKFAHVHVEREAKSSVVAPCVKVAYKRKTRWDVDNTTQPNNDNPVQEEGKPMWEHLTAPSQIIPLPQRKPTRWGPPLEQKTIVHKTVPTETVLRVPVEMAEAAIKAAMDSGITNIKLEIIGI